MTERRAVSTRTKSLEFSRVIPCGLVSPDTTVVKDQLFYRDRTLNNKCTSSKKMKKIYHIPQAIQDNRAWEKEMKARESLTARKEELSFSVINLRKIHDQNLQAKLAKQRTELQAISGQKIMDQSLQRTECRSKRQDDIPKHTERLPIVEKHRISCKSICNDVEASQCYVRPEMSSGNPNSHKFRLLDRRPDNLWNKYSVISLKHLRNCITDKIIKMDEQGYRNIEAKENQAQVHLGKLRTSKKYVYGKIRGLRNKALPSQSEIEIDTSRFDSQGKSVRLKFDDSRFNGLIVNDVNRVAETSGNPLVELMAQKSHLAQSLGLRSQRLSKHLRSKLIQDSSLTDRVDLSKEYLSKINPQEIPKASNVGMTNMTSRDGVALKKTVKSIQNFEQRQRMRKSIIRDVNYPRIYLDQIKNFIF